MAQRLQDRTALVTGSTSGIGAGIAAGLAAEGAHVVVSGRDVTRGEAVVRQIRDAGGRAELVLSDLGASAQAARQLATDASEALGGRVDVLVNNVGIYPSAPTADVDDATLDAVLATNIRAPHVLTAALAPPMAQRGSGVIINIGSWISTVGLPSGSLYSATKAAVEQLARGWAAEYGPAGVRVNAIAPGVTLTAGTDGHREYLEDMVAKFPAGRFGTPEDIAHAAVYLASDEGAFIHGTVLLVDGGALGTRMG
jgi:NAD(P)-dependent dehydrogenase (short-subunit alcohol dehydrogenase family)